MLEAGQLDTKLDLGSGREVILPLLQPVIIIVLLLRIAEALKVFDVVASLTVGGPGNATQSLCYLAFRTGLRFFDVGYASAHRLDAARLRHGHRDPVLQARADVYA